MNKMFENPYNLKQDWQRGDRSVRELRRIRRPATEQCQEFQF